MDPIEPRQSPPRHSALEDAPSSAQPLGYETLGEPEPSGPRPPWVYAIAAVYLLLLIVFLASPTVLSLAFSPTNAELGVFVACVATITLCGVSLLVIPVRAARRRPVTQRSIWISVIGSGLLAAVLLLGGGMAFCEYLMVDSEKAMWIVLAAIMVWAIWGVVFGLIVVGGREYRAALWLHRCLIAGSLLELLVAVPCHVIVRRRQDCCGGIATGFGICVGVVVMFISFGPSVLLLFYNRKKQITRK